MYCQAASGCSARAGMAITLPPQLPPTPGSEAMRHFPSVSGASFLRPDRIHDGAVVTANAPLALPGAHPDDHAAMPALMPASYVSTATWNASSTSGLVSKTSSPLGEKYFSETCLTVEKTTVVSTLWTTGWRVASVYFLPMSMKPSHVDHMAATSSGSVG